MATQAEPLRAEPEAGRRILAALQERIGPQRFKAWFTHGTQMTVSADSVKVAAPNPFVANWIETHYVSEIAAAAEGEMKRRPSVTVLVDPSLIGQLRKRQLDIQAEMVAKVNTGRARPRRPAASQALRHRLEDFVVGESNRLAYAAALAVSEGRKPPFNPLFVHGPCGVGKTHLLQGICRAVSRREGNGRGPGWRYVTGESFTNEFIAALRQKRLQEFRARYRRLDLLAIDDVHFLAAKKATQDEFLHTFNAIEGSGNQIVMASDAHPRLVGDLNEQLVSRFVAGMVVKIEPPDHETRLKILQMRARAMNFRVDPSALRYIAMHVRGSVRELEGTLTKLAALSTLAGGKVTLQTVTEALADHLAQTDSVITLGDIEAVTAAFFGVTAADLHSSRRTRTVSVARMVTMYLARRHTQMSYPEIGRFMGKNHSSVVLGVQRMERLLVSQDDLRWTSPMGARTMPAAKVVQMLTEQFT
jgi:chromosomal replication initiator protein